MKKRKLYCVVEASDHLKGVFYNEIVAFRNFDYHAGDKIEEVEVDFPVWNKIYYVTDPRLMFFPDINSRTLKNGQYISHYYSIKVNKEGPDEDLIENGYYPDQQPELFV